MNIKRVIIVLIILLITTSIIYYINSQKNSEKLNDGKIGVGVSIGPEVEFVKAVGGDKVDVTLMMPPSADPHSYEPLPNQLSQVSNAKMYAEIGTSLEFETNYMDNIKAANPNMLIVNTSKGINLIPNSAESEANTVDPHVWVDPKNAEIMVNNIYDGLVEVDPGDKEYFTKNRDNYIQQIKELDSNTTKLLKSKNGSYILIYHPSFGYYAKDYNMTQIGAMINDEEPSPQRIAMMIDIAKKYNIKTLYSEPQYNLNFMESIASQAGARVVTVNDLDENYLENMAKIATTFANNS
jgi:zinc transport system substrate-binding protein